MAGLNKVSRRHNINITKLYKSLPALILLFECDSESAWQYGGNSRHSTASAWGGCSGSHNQWVVQNKVVTLVEHQEQQLATVKLRKLVRFCHVHEALSMTVLPGILEGSQRRGSQIKNWLVVLCKTCIALARAHTQTLSLSPILTLPSMILQRLWSRTFFYRPFTTV